MSAGLVYVTCSDNGLYGLRHLLDRGVAVARVITLPPALGAKYEVSGYQDPTPLCRARGVEVRALDDYAVREADLGDAPRELLVVNGWNRLIAPEVLGAFRLGGLGIHAGHPPIGQGRAPLPWNLIKGHTDLEVYVFRLTPRADDGEMLARRVVEITAHDDVRTLYEKVMFAGAHLFEEAIRALHGGHAIGVRQDPRFAVVYGKRTPEDGLIDFRESCEALVDFVRAQTRPYPGAFCHLAGERWKVWRALPFDRFAFRDRPRTPGEVLAALPTGLVVQTGSSPVWLVDVTAGERQVVPDALERLEPLVGRVLDGREGPLAPR